VHFIYEQVLSLFQNPVAADQRSDETSSKLAVSKTEVFEQPQLSDTFHYGAFFSESEVHTPETYLIRRQKVKKNLRIQQKFGKKDKKPRFFQAPIQPRACNPAGTRPVRGICGYSAGQNHTTPA
jgi:hypothetical protein